MKQFTDCLAQSPRSMSGCYWEGLFRLHGPSPSALRSRLARTRAPAARSFNGRVYFRKVRVPRGVRRVPA